MNPNKIHRSPFEKLQAKDKVGGLGETQHHISQNWLMGGPTPIEREYLRNGKTRPGRYL